jgi:gamma-glutamyltranspeptidase/glutathione hydrolase
MSFTARPALRGSFGAVASTHWIASAIGMRILEAGGNAFDAAAATGFALQVVEPDVNGPGGEVAILAAPTGANEPVVICGQGPAPRAATIARIRVLGLDHIPGSGHLAAVVPGAFGAWLTLLRDHGTMRLADVLQPAIFYAGGGHPLGWRVPEAIAAAKRRFELHWRSSASIYLPGGETPKSGQVFRNLPLAMLYAAILADATRAVDREAQIERARDYWYCGPVAEAIARFVRIPTLDDSGRAHAGLLDGDDLAAWTPPVERPVRVALGDLRVFGCGAWSHGPALLQTLQILDGLGIETLPPTGPDFVHALAETAKLVRADREAWQGDSARIDLAALLDPAYARSRRQLIGASAAAMDRPGLPDAAQPSVPTMDPAEAADGDDTCHVDVADRWGNLVAASPSGGGLAASPVIPELGFGLSTRARNFRLHAGRANSLVPGTRPRAAPTPTLVERDGAPWLAFGTSGGDREAQWSALFLAHHAHHAMSLQAALEAPAFLSEHQADPLRPQDAASAALAIEGRFAHPTRDALARRGHRLRVVEAWREGRLCACAIEPGGGGRVLVAAADPRTMQGYALAR